MLKMNDKVTKNNPLTPNFGNNVLCEENSIILFLEYTKCTNLTITDKLSIFFKNKEVYKYKLGNYYAKLYRKIKHMNKEQIKEYFAPKHNHNFTEAC